jgi:hypothetical protein
MPFCQHCGNTVDQLLPAVAAAETVSAEVEIARINAERDVEVAKIAARQDRDWNETRVEVAEIEAVAEVAAAEAEAEVIGEIIAAESGAETAGETGEPIVVQVPDAEPQEEPVTGEPPVVDVSAPREKKSGGYWGAYK